MISQSIPSKASPAGSFRLATLVAFALAGGVQLHAAAVDFYWTGANSSAWTGTNWSFDAAGNTPTGAPPDATRDVIFSSTNAGNRSTTLGANFSINSLQVIDTNPIVIGGVNTLTIAGGEGGGGIFVDAGSLTISAPMTFTTTGETVSVASGAQASISGAINGAGGLVKTGAGTLTVSATNNYQDRTSIREGQVTVASGSIGRLGFEKDVFVGELAGDSATLRVETGGTIYADFTKLGTDAASSGTLQIAGGTLAGNSTVLVGDSGTGQLEVSSGLADALFVYVGSSTGSTGTVVVSGGALTTEDLYVGSEGSGTLTSTGGTVSVDTGSGTLTVAELSGSTGVLNIGNGSTFGTIQASSIHGGSGSATVNFNHTGTLSSFQPKLTGSLSVVKSGSGTTILTGTNSYTGSTTINGGTLRMNGQFVSAVTVGNATTFGGSGSVGAVTVNGTISPGADTNMIGTLATGAEIWNGGGSYAWDINNAAGAAGTGWDLLSSSGSLAIAADSGTPFQLTITSLTLANALGDAANFDAGMNYAWTIVSTSSGITGFDPSAILIDTTQFSNTFDGTFSVELSPNTNDLVLVYTALPVPEPSILALVGLGAAAMFVRARRKKLP